MIKCLNCCFCSIAGTDGNLINLDGIVDANVLNALSVIVAILIVIFIVVGPNAFPSVSRNSQGN